MNKSILKLTSIILIALFIIALIPMAVIAASSEGVILEKTDGEKIIYLKGLDGTEFKYAFSNSESDAESATYITATKDSNGEFVGFLEKGKTYEYMFIKNGENTETVNLSKLKSITESEITEVENLTKVIKVSTDESESKISKDGDTTITTTTGKIVVTENGKYQYELLEVVDKNNTTKSINSAALDLYNQVSKLSSAEKMYDKLSAEVKIRDDFNNLVKNATWKDANNNTIKQPKDSQKDEVFIALIREIKDGKTVREDVQIMTCGRADAQGVEKTEKEVEKETKLPITGENLALYIIFGIIILAIIVLIVRMKTTKNDKE